MKIRVIGWTNYSDSRFENDGVTYAEFEAIANDIRENGYMFTGMHHQGYKYCVPVLNDGKKRTFSERGFGKVMARGHDVYTSGGYVDYAFNWGYSSDELKMPGKEREIPDGYVPDNPEDLYEEFEIEVSREDFDKARDEGVLSFNHDFKYRLMSGGDYLVVKCGPSVANYRISRYERRESHENPTREREKEIFVATVKVELTPKGE